MELRKLQEAARLVGVSYPTLKQWIYAGKVRSVKTVGGHHRIPQDEIDRLLNQNEKVNRTAPTGLDAISGRNKLLGRVSEVRYEGLLAQITIDVGGQTMTSIITADAARHLELEKGVAVHALVKATEVMVIRG